MYCAAMHVNPQVAGRVLFRGISKSNQVSFFGQAGVIAAALAFAVCVCAARADDKPKPLVVHEWGTFTTLQDDQGVSISGINADDEPLPDFVHRLATQLLIGKTEAPPNFFQGAPECHPDVTMRLETPVIYFHPPEGWKPQAVDVHVGFHNGWLTEFYPKAQFKAPGFDAKHPDEVYTERSTPVEDWHEAFGRIKNGSAGDLSWKGLSLDGAGAGPETTEKVWLAPRAVEATAVKNVDGESEKFLFYRGVAHNDAPLRIVRNNGTLEIHDNIRVFSMSKASKSLPFHAAWLLDVRPGGTCAYRALGVLKWGTRAQTPADFDKTAYSEKSMEALRSEMQAALMREGLFEDEAKALLNTWQISYFKSPGLRLFYICPRVEVNTLLPLEISAAGIPVTVTRVMVGRIEMETPEQRELLAKIAAGPAPKIESIPGFPTSYFTTHPEANDQALYNDVMAGRQPMLALGIPIPEIYADFLKLGRFREALVLDEEAKRPTAALKEFILQTGIRE